MRREKQSAHARTAARVRSIDTEAETGNRNVCGDVGFSVFNGANLFYVAVVFAKLRVRL